MQVLVSIGLVVTDLCCHKINMNTKEKDIIRSILKSVQQSFSVGLQCGEWRCILLETNMEEYCRLFWCGGWWTKRPTVYYRTGVSVLDLVVIAPIPHALHT